MSSKPIFVATHPRACSTAFERVFMTRRDTLNCVHEPFGDAFYYGPERLSSRFESDLKAREDSGFSTATFQNIFDHIERKESEGKRIFIKDIIHYLVPPNGKPATIAPSLQRVKRGVGTNGEEPATVNGERKVNGTVPTAPYPFATEAEPDNPTVVPSEMLAKFHFTFLIRDPHSSIPSYYRCTVPPLDKVTGFDEFDPSEAGYDEVRRVFEYLRNIGYIGPQVTATTIDSTPRECNGFNRGRVDICVLDADELLDDPSGIIEAYCSSVGLRYEPEMLSWDGEEHQSYATEAFEKWKGFHEDAIHSRELKPRVHKKQSKPEADWDKEWSDKYGAEAAMVIRETVDRNMDDYRYMKQFALKACSGT